MRKTKFKEGDWGFCNFELMQIEKIQDGNITSVSTGYGSYGFHSFNDLFFPMDMQTKRVSDHVKSYSDEFHQLKNNALNFPALQSKLVEFWLELVKVKENPEELSKQYEKLKIFCDGVVQKVNELQELEVEGVKLLR